MVLKVGVSSGIYYAAREAELHSAIRKLGYTLTRGVANMEIPVDVAHEVTFTQGHEIRHIAKKQEVQLNLHGDLAVPMEIPERGEWRDAHDRMIKSIRSAVFLGAHYIDFHFCLNLWLELITYSGRKLSASFVDSSGRFISEILYENKPTREWFIKEKGDIYLIDILNRDEKIEMLTQIKVEQERWQKTETDKRVRNALRPLSGVIASNLRPGDSVQNFIEGMIESAFIRGIHRPIGIPEVDDVMVKVHDELRRDVIMQMGMINDTITDAYLERKFSNPHPVGRRWFSEEHRGALGLVDGYNIMAHYMYYTQDPLWVAMAEQYKDVLKKYGYRIDKSFDYRGPATKHDWLDEAWRKAERENDREYKEFFYAAVAAKYIEGHLKKAFEWLYGDFIKKEIPILTKDKEEQADLIKIARNLIIGLENPDAREPSHAGLYYIFRPRQMYACVKTIRNNLKTNKVMMIVDHEQLATQGIDALLESRADILSRPDFGKLVISCHANHPNPLHAHYPVELGDVILYELLYNLRVTGFGVDQVGYMIFERGGGQDPYVHSVDALRLMKQSLETNPPTPVKKLPLEFFGMKGLTAGDVQRQMQIIRDKAFEPMKDLLEIPEEEWTMLSKTAVKKGKRPEVWKRGEFR